MRISEQYAVVPLIEAKDYGSAGIDSDSVNMGKLHSLCAVFAFGAITGNSILKVYTGATAGTKTTAVAFKYRIGGGDYKASSADILGAFTDVTSSGLTLTAATFDHREVVVEVDAQAMPDGKEWLTFEIDNTATVLLVGAVGIGSARANGNTNPTVI
jgi:hypothetical protein